MLTSPGAPTGATVLTPAGHAYNMTAHSFEIPMVISTTTTTEIPQQPTSNDNNQQQQPSTNDGQQIQMVKKIKIVFLISLRFFCLSLECNYKSGTFTNFTWCFTKW
jgi:hypothetical protein